MASKKLIEFFNNLDGKEVTNETFANSTNSTINELGELLKTNNKVASKGAFKTCSYFGNKQIFACLKSKTPCSSIDKFFYRNKTYQIKRINEKLISKGACIPRLYSIFFADKKYIEIQHRIAGSPVAICQLKNFSKKILGHSFDYFNFDDKEKTQSVSEYIKFQKQKQKLADALFDYNLTQQYVMLSLPQKAYDKLFSTILMLNDRNVKLEDNHSENLLVGKKGFTFVDLNYKQISTHSSGNVNKQSNTDCVRDLIFPFSFSCTFVKILSQEQLSILERNNVMILKHLIDAVSNNKIVVEGSNNNILNNCMGMTGISNFLDNASFIFESQTALRQQKKMVADPLITSIHKAPTFTTPKK